MCDVAYNAHAYANIMGPISGNLGHANYGLIAMIGCVFALANVGNLTLGSIASFLQFTKQFNMPVNQVMQQFANVISALAGAERIFEVMDEKPEIDEGKVTLVNAEIKADGTKDGNKKTLV